MKDPTYVKAEIDVNPEWELAYALSEIMNDNAPLGWSKYCSIARCLLAAGYQKAEQTFTSPKGEQP